MQTAGSYAHRACAWDALVTKSRAIHLITRLIARDVRSFSPAPGKTGENVFTQCKTSRHLIRYEGLRRIERFAVIDAAGPFKYGPGRDPHCLLYTSIYRRIFWSVHAPTAAIKVISSFR